MKNKMEEIDKLIKESLTKEEAQFYDQLDEQGMLASVGGLFRSKHRGILIMMNIVNLISFILFVYCVVQFLGTNDTNELIQWAAGGFICIMITGMLKLFAWLQMDKNALMRELKRLELQVSSMAGKMS
jgi:hypothetical protein